MIPDFISGLTTLRIPISHSPIFNLRARVIIAPMHKILTKLNVCIVYMCPILSFGQNTNL